MKKGEGLSGIIGIVFIGLILFLFWNIITEAYTTQNEISALCEEKEMEYAQSRINRVEYCFERETGKAYLALEVEDEFVLAEAVK